MILEAIWPMDPLSENVVVLNDSEFGVAIKWIYHNKSQGL